MGRQRVLRHAERARDVARRQSLRLMPHEQAKGVEPGRLRQRREAGEGGFHFHNSRYIEIDDGSMTFQRRAPQRHCWPGRRSVTKAYPSQGAPR